jgi:hypothetical protein
VDHAARSGGEILRLDALSGNLPQGFFLKVKGAPRQSNPG